jgi:hypothetical protein
MFCGSTSFAVERGIKRIQLSSPAPVETPYLSGKFRALVIGNNDYNDPEKLWPSLKTAVADAEAVAEILKTDYGFAEITLLKNTKQRDIVRAFNHLAKTVQDSDSVLIYYAGHGYLNEDTKEGFWIPVDAEGRDDSTFVPNSTIKTKLGVIADKARHVLLVSDSCFSGALLREGNRGMSLDQKNERYYQKVAKKKSVQILAAGGLEFVDDNYKGTRHSPFTYYFLQSLKDNNARYFEATDLSQETSRNVSVNTVQTPESGVLQGAGHAGGEFFFLRKNTSEALSKMESKPALPKKPSSGSFSLADLDAHADEEESVRKAWQQKQGEMNAAVKQVRSYNRRNVSPSLKGEAWRRFIAAFSEDNPYSSEDENLRKEAHNQIDNWKTQQEHQGAEKKRLAEAKRKAEEERKKQKELAALQQKQKSPLGTVIDFSTGLMWQKKPDSVKRTWEEAKRYCRYLSLGGFSDWVLPSKVVLEDMFRKKEIFDSYKLSSLFWSSTYVAGKPSYAWFVHYYNGFTDNYDKLSEYYVRCVRGQKLQSGTSIEEKDKNYYTIQVLASRRHATAKIMVEKLKLNGFKDAFIFKHTTGNKTLYRVRVGKLERSEIQNLMNELKELKFINSVQATRF